MLPAAGGALPLVIQFTTGLVTFNHSLLLPPSSSACSWQSSLVTCHLSLFTCHLSLALGGPLPDPAGACSRPQQPSLSRRLASCCLDGHLAGEEDKDDLNDDKDDHHNDYGMLAWHLLRICFSEERLENSILIKLKSYLVILRTSHPSSALVTCPLLVAFQVSPHPGCTIMIRKHYRLKINNNEIWAPRKRIRHFTLELEHHIYVKEGSNIFL